jgi:hypothetical protein
LHHAAFDAFGTNPNLLDRGASLMTNRLEIWVPEFFSSIVGVGNIISVLGFLAAQLANAGHYMASFFLASHKIATGWPSSFNLRSIA